MRRALLLFILCVQGLANGQSVTVSFDQQVSPAPHPGATLRLDDLPLERSHADIRLAIRQEAQFGVTVHYRARVAQVGNLVVSGAAHAGTSGRYTTALWARGVVGPVALRTRLAVSDGLEPLGPVAPSPLPPLLELGEGPLLFSADLGGIYRLGREALLDGDVTVALRGGSIGGGFDLEYRRLRVSGLDDITYHLGAFVTPGATGWSTQAGFGYQLNRRRAPSWQVVAWLGASGEGLRPGLQVAGANEYGFGRFALQLSALPFSVRGWPYDLQVSLLRPVAREGSVEFLARIGVDSAHALQLGGRVSLETPLGGSRAN